MPDYEDIDQVPFTTPQQVQTAFQSLAGIIKGIAADGALHPEEIDLLERFISERPLLQRPPFRDFQRLLAECLEDGVLDVEEKEDLLAFCLMASGEHDFYDQATRKMQQLQGILAGVAADRVITTEEAEYVQSWMAINDHLLPIWPFAEVQQILDRILADGQVDARESDELCRFIDGCCASTTNTRSLVKEEAPSRIDDLFDDHQPLPFDGVAYCFTGTFQDYKRKELQAMVRARGGRPASSITKKLDYLVVGVDGNPCYTFACYGRKVEQALRYREDARCALRIISEPCFLTAITAATEQE